ncbi:MAG TPA: hypothetical protein H9836_16885 [Candidatus Nocardiopsis merdipullorum]|nr:hypothetical protein [Candidatus Nocardiopsis merdipullorum]
MGEHCHQHFVAATRLRGLGLTVVTRIRGLLTVLPGLWGWAVLARLTVLSGLRGLLAVLPGLWRLTVGLLFTRGLLGCVPGGSVSRLSGLLVLAMSGLSP